MRALELLNYLGAIDDEGELTAVSGRSRGGGGGQQEGSGGARVAAASAEPTLQGSSEPVKVACNGSDHLGWHQRRAGRLLSPCMWACHTTATSDAAAWWDAHLSISLSPGPCAPCLIIPQIGSVMAEFPLDPQLAKMMVAAPQFK
jgi:hypothetical protein